MHTGYNKETVISSPNINLKMHISPVLQTRMYMKPKQVKIIFMMQVTAR